MSKGKMIVKKMLNGLKSCIGIEKAKDNESTIVPSTPRPSLVKFNHEKEEKNADLMHTLTSSDIGSSSALSTSSDAQIFASKPIVKKEVVKNVVNVDAKEASMIATQVADQVVKSLTGLTGQMDNLTKQVETHSNILKNSGLVTNNIVSKDNEGSSTTNQTGALTSSILSKIESLTPGGTALSEGISTITNSITLEQNIVAEVQDAEKTLVNGTMDKKLAEIEKIGNEVVIYAPLIFRELEQELPTPITHLINETTAEIEKIESEVSQMLNAIINDTSTAHKIAAVEGIGSELVTEAKNIIPEITNAFSSDGEGVQGALETLKTFTDLASTFQHGTVEQKVDATINIAEKVVGGVSHIVSDLMHHHEEVVVSGAPATVIEV